MPNLLFKKLKVLSKTAKSANQFEFHEKLNLITAKDNSVGKSTLAKLLLWSLGCEPAFDTKWKSQDCETILEFSINDSEYAVYRHKDIVRLRENGKVSEYSKITGDYSEKIASILGFGALLPNRSESKLETPPPAYYFLPFYIDQKKSWSIAWDNFENLAQYEKWKSTIIRYHVGLLTKEHFELEKQKFEKKAKQKIAENEIDRYTTTLEVVSTYTPDLNLTISDDKFEKMTDEIRKDLKELSDEQEKVLDLLAKLQAEKSYLENQTTILNDCIEELQKDYTFAVENVEDDVLECPLCATQHDNNIFNKASILNDKVKAEEQLKELIKNLSRTNKQYEKAFVRHNEIKSEINKINDRYVIVNDNDTPVSLNNVIEFIAGNSIKDNVVNAKKEKLYECENLATEVSKLSETQKGLLSKEDKDKIINDFILIFSNYTKSLNATAINLSEINSPLSYNKVVKEGGAAESARAILAYYIAIFSLICRAKSEVIAPYIIDTPNQQEQSLGNYDKIIEIIFSELSNKTQVIICAMDNSLLAPFQENGKVIELDDKKLLLSEHYEKLNSEFLKF